MRNFLVVVDMQNDFIDGVLGTKEAQAILPKVVKKIKEWNGPIIVTQDTHQEDIYKETQESENVPFHCGLNTDGWKIHKDIIDALDGKNFRLIRKNQFAVHPNVMKKYTLFTDTHELVGLCTDICVLCNAVLLQSLGQRVVIDASCCAGTTPENHKAALTAMVSCCMEVKGL